MTPLRFGILSTAVINDDVLPAMAAVDVAEAAAVASRDEGRARSYAEAHGIPRSYGSYRELLESADIDAVYIPLPNSLHRDWTSAALSAGKHVLCEKPLTIHADEAAALFAEADAAGLVLMEAFMYRHHPTMLSLQQVVSSGEVGELQTVRSSFSFDVGESPADIRLSAELGGGALRDVGCYCVSLSRLVTGENPVTIAAHQTMTATGVDERTAALLTYPGGATATFDCSIRAPLESGAAVVGTGGVISIPAPWLAHEPPRSLSIEYLDGTSRTIDGSSRNSYELEIENFCGAVRGDHPPRITAAETIDVLRTIDHIEAVAVRAVR